MSLADWLTPKDTEEVRPGLFVQKRGNRYRQITPAAWDGKVNWKVAILGQNWMRNLFLFALIIYLSWAYSHDISTCREITNNINENPTQFCKNIISGEYRAPEQELIFNFSNLKLGDEK